MKINKKDGLFWVFFLAAVVITILHFLFHPVRVLGMNTSIFYMDEKVTLTAFFTTVVSFLTGFLLVANRHLPYQRWLDETFGQHEIRAARDGFHVLACRNR